MLLPMKDYILLDKYSKNADRELDLFFYITEIYIYMLYVNSKCIIFDSWNLYSYK